MMPPSAIETGWMRSMRAAERVWERACRAADALERAAIPYAVVGGNAVAEYVGRVDDAAVRATRDVDILVRRDDFPAVRTALEAAGFVHAFLLDVDMFLDGTAAKPSEAVHILYAGEKVRPDHDFPSPDVTETEPAGRFRVVRLDALVHMKLISNRRKDQVHLLDLIAVGLVDRSWLPKLPPTLADRLRTLLENPDG